MRKTILFLFCAFVGYGTATDKPYEATWLRLERAGSSYVVYNYPFMSAYGDLDTTMKTPEMARVRGNQITWVFYSESPTSYSFDRVEEKDNGDYFFSIKTEEKPYHYSFKWVDKEKHIAKWIIYFSDGTTTGKTELYVDSLYNTFPIVDYIWDD